MALTGFQSAVCAPSIVMPDFSSVEAILQTLGTQKRRALARRTFNDGNATLAAECFVEKFGCDDSLHVVIRPRVSGEQCFASIGGFIRHGQNGNACICGLLQCRDDGIAVQRRDKQHIDLAVYQRADVAALLGNIAVGAKRNELDVGISLASSSRILVTAAI